MTEAEWLQATEPNLMLDILKGLASERKLRLFALACCRRMWHLLKDERSRRGVEVMEQFIDGLNSHKERSAAAAAAWEAERACYENEVIGATRAAALAAARVVDRDWPLFCSHQMPKEKAGGYAWHAVRDTEFAVDRQERSGWLRDIFGNPFRVTRSNMEWRTPTVVRLAEIIYDTRAFERMPELVVELAKSGCKDADIMDHCHQHSGHIRGCWVIDLSLGKE